MITLFYKSGKRETLEIVCVYMYMNPCKYIHRHIQYTHTQTYSHIYYIFFNCTEYEMRKFIVFTN